MTEFHFAQPAWLIAGGGAVLLLWALVALSAWRRRRALARFSGTRLGAELTRSVSGWRRALKVALLTGGVASLFCALAQPRWGYHFEETERQGVDILFAVDTSRSMLANDLSPDRLSRAKLAVSDLVRQFEGDRAGLVAFAGEAFLQVPMTVDRDVFERSLAELDTDIIPHGGSDLGAAIREATAAFGDVADEKLLVLITDGENLEGDAVEAARQAAGAGVRVFTVGVGSADGALLEVPGPNGPTLVRDEHGEPVRSRLDEATLREIAEVTGGAYEPLGASGTGLARLYAQHLSHLPRHAVAARQHKVFHERFQWPLGLGILLLLLEPLIGERRRFGLRREARRKKSRRWRVRGSSALASAGAAAVMLVSVPAFAQDWAGAQRLWSRDVPDAREAQRAYERGDYDAARRTWEQSAEQNARAEHRFNAGAAAYRTGDWGAAEEAFQGAVQGGDPALQQRAYYDLGNAQFRRGQDALEGADGDRDATKAAWREAIESYESALALDGDDADAQHNLDVVRRALAALEQEQAEDQAQQEDQQQSGGEGQQDQQQAGGEGQQDQQQSGGEGQQDQQQSGGEGQQDPQQSGSEGQQDQQQSGGESDGESAEQQGSSGDGSSEQRDGEGEQGDPRDGRGGSDGPRKESDGEKQRSESGSGGTQGEPQPESGSEGEPQRESGSEGEPEADGEPQAEGESEAEGTEPSDEREGSGAGLRKHAEPKDSGEPEEHEPEDQGTGAGGDEASEEPTQPEPAAGAEQSEGDEEEGAAMGAGEPTDEAEAEGEEGTGVAFTGSTGPGEDVGRLSRDQAVQLLRSLRHEERRFPLTGRRRGEPADAEASTRNW